MISSLDLSEDLLYPDSDGKPMAENTEQYRWIVLIKENLEVLFAAYAHVFIAADLLWYPAPSKTAPAPSQAPDVMVIFGRPKGKRRSYRQWQEDNIPPQVVFEILSPSNKTREGDLEMSLKFDFYERYGVEEYYIYDPETLMLEGWIRQSDRLLGISRMEDWISPRLGIRFIWQPRQELVLYRPDGQRFLNSIEMRDQVDRAQRQADLAQYEADRAQRQADLAQQQADLAQRQADLAQQQADLAQQQAEQERQRADAAQHQAEQEHQRAEQAERNQQAAIPQLLALGLSVEQVATALGLPVSVVEEEV